jgi:hypothetical protein
MTRRIKLLSTGHDTLTLLTNSEPHLSQDLANSKFGRAANGQARPQEKKLKEARLDVVVTSIESLVEKYHRLFVSIRIGVPHLQGSEDRKFEAVIVCVNKNLLSPDTYDVFSPEAEPCDENRTPLSRNARPR